MSTASHMIRADETFEGIDPAHLDTSGSAAIDALPFGVVGLSEAGITEVYNATEARFAGIKPQTVIGEPFFLMAGVCMNNFLVAQRFEDEQSIDAILDYVLTFRMRPTPVKLRLLKRPDLRRRYLLVRR